MDEDIKKRVLEEKRKEWTKQLCKNMKIDNSEALVNFGQLGLMTVSELVGYLEGAGDECMDLAFEAKNEEIEKKYVSKEVVRETELGIQVMKLNECEFDLGKCREEIERKYVRKEFIDMPEDMVIRSLEEGKRFVESQKRKS